MKYLNLLALIATLAFLSACAPKDVTQGTSSDEYYGYIPENNSDMASHSRYPTGGNRIQQRLHLMNQPSEQMRLRNSYNSYFEKRLGEPLKKAEPNTQKYRSPFIEY